MMEKEILQLLAAGGDITIMIIGLILLKHHTRLTKIEAKLEQLFSLNVFSGLVKEKKIG